jgi:hypothetical protein
LDILKIIPNIGNVKVKNPSGTSSKTDKEVSFRLYGKIWEGLQRSFWDGPTILMFFRGAIGAKASVNE